MTSFIKSANLFPFGQLWRIGGDPDVNLSELTTHIYIDNEKRLLNG